MYALYGVKKGDRKVVAVFDSEQQLQAYVRWATLSTLPNGDRKFEQKTPLVGCDAFECQRIDDSQATELDVPRNPSPGML